MSSSKQPHGYQMSWACTYNVCLQAHTCLRCFYRAVLAFLAWLGCMARSVADAAWSFSSTRTAAARLPACSALSAPAGCLAFCGPSAGLAAAAVGVSVAAVSLVCWSCEAGGDEKGLPIGLGEDAFAAARCWLGL